jgi:hypothetical protein
MKVLKKVLNLYVLRILQLAIAIYLSSLAVYGVSIDDGIFVPEAITYLPIILNCILILLCALEFLHVKPIVRLLYLFIAFIISLSSMGESMAYLNASVWLFGIITALVTLVSLILAKGQLKRESEKRGKSGQGTLPLFYYCKSDYILTIILGVIAGIILVALIFIYQLLVPAEWKWTIFFPVCADIFCAIFVSYIINHFRKCVSGMDKTCDYSSFIASSEKLKEEKLNPEAYKYVSAIQVFYSLGCDMSYADKLMENFQPATAKSIKGYCDVVNIYYLIFKGEYAKAGEALYISRMSSPVNKMLDVANKMLIAFNAEEEVSDIQITFPVNTKHVYKNIFNAVVLMRYYAKRGDNVTAKNYANIILSGNPQLKEFIAMANNVAKISD